MASEIDREDVVLLILFAAERLLGTKTLRGVTRLEKLIFLFSKEAPTDEIREQFAFRAYKYGPFSSKIYDAVDFLEGIDLLKSKGRAVESAYAAAEQDEMAVDELEQDVPSVNAERTFTLTAAGRKAAEALREQWRRERPRELDDLDKVVERVGHLPLNALIRYVYQRHPDMAKESIHPEAQRVHTER